jgi:hypothetical protein
MRRKLKVTVSDPTGTPYANIPCDCTWDLIEYLSYQRVTVNYDFQATHFTVAFPKQNVRSAQELLDHWADGDVEGAPAGSSQPVQYGR